jgi:hypothetical protein
VLSSPSNIEIAWDFYFRKYANSWKEFYSAPIQPPLRSPPRSCSEVLKFGKLAWALLYAKGLGYTVESTELEEGVLCHVMKSLAVACSVGLRGIMTANGFSMAIPILVTSLHACLVSLWLVPRCPVTSFWCPIPYDDHGYSALEPDRVLGIGTRWEILLLWGNEHPSNW